MEVPPLYDAAISACGFQSPHGRGGDIVENSYVLLNALAW